jgi:hypothetical protein
MDETTSTEQSVELMPDAPTAPVADAPVVESGEPVASEPNPDLDPADPASQTRQPGSVVVPYPAPAVDMTVATVPVAQAKAERRNLLDEIEADLVILEGLPAHLVDKIRAYLRGKKADV